MSIVQDLYGLTGGELYYQHFLSMRTGMPKETRHICQAVVGKTYVSKFLEEDTDWCYRERVGREGIHTVKSMMQKCSRFFNRHTLLESKTAPEVLNLRIQQIMQRLETFTADVMQQSCDISSSADMNIHSSLNAYFEIITSDAARARSQMSSKIKDLRVQFEQAKMKRDIMLFSVHLREETDGAVLLVYLEESSAQYQRCEKAVIDNLGQDCTFDATVVNVLKLENSHLMKGLQSVTSRNASGKIKGLFTFVNKSELFALCAYGLHAQTLDNNASGHIKFPNIFKEVWYSSPVSTGAPTDVLHSTFGSAQRLASQQYLSYLSFEKRSAPKSLESWSEDRLSEGIFLVLCRAYVVKPLTVMEPITSDLIQSAIRDGYDSIHSSSTGNYALLCPESVLPEFIIQVSFDRKPASSSSTDETQKLSATGASEVVDNISPNSRLRRRILEKQEITAAIGDSCKNFRSSRKALLQKHISVLKMQFI